ncbi:MAG: hypothetical protein LUI60_00795 [Clostridia bacterium]|nr:hypothetical protein [Clostridia bacterium]
MTEYLLAACGAVFLSVIVSFIIPQGKLGKTITAVLRLACIVILISPLADLFNFSFGEYEDYIDYGFICEVYSENQSDTLEELLYSEFETETDCTVTVVYSDGFCVESVEVCLLNGNTELAEKIYEYLQSNDYINITVYEQTDGI